MKIGPVEYDFRNRVLVKENKRSPGYRFLRAMASQITTSIEYRTFFSRLYKAYAKSRKNPISKEMVIYILSLGENWNTHADSRYDGPQYEKELLVARMLVFFRHLCMYPDAVELLVKSTTHDQVKRKLLRMGSYFDSRGCNNEWDLKQTTLPKVLDLPEAICKEFISKGKGMGYYQAIKKLIGVLGIDYTLMLLKNNKPMVIPYRTLRFVYDTPQDHKDEARKKAFLLINNGFVKYAHILFDHCTANRIPLWKVPIQKSEIEFAVRNHHIAMERLALEEAKRDKIKAANQEKKIAKRNEAVKENLNREIGGYTFHLLNSFYEYVKEGKVMQNCIATYFNRSDSYIISVRRCEYDVVDIVADIELVKLSKWLLEQAYSYRNNVVSPEVNKVISKYIKQINSK